MATLIVWQHGEGQADSKRKVFFGQTGKGMGVEAKRQKKEQKDTRPIRIRGVKTSQLFSYLSQHTFQSPLQDHMMSKICEAQVITLSLWLWLFIEVS